jgi:hypothetical protein
MFPTVLLSKSLSDEERFARSYETRDNGCWEWVRSLTENTPNGYGLIMVNGKRMGAHRYAFVMATGQAIPRGWHVCHRCDNPRCVNPEHLFLGSAQDNQDDRKRKLGKPMREPYATRPSSSRRVARRAQTAHRAGPHMPLPPRS